MLNEVCGLFEDRSRNTEFYVNTERLYFHSEGQQEVLTILCDAINKNKEVAGLLNLIDGDMWIKGKTYYSTKYIFSMLCFTKPLLNNLLWLVDTNIKKEGVLSKTIFNGVFISGEVKKRIEKLPAGTTAKDALNSCVKVGGVYFYNNIFARCKLRKIFISNDKIRRIIGVLEKVGSDSGTYEIIQSAIKEIDEVMNTMIDSKAICYGSNSLTHHVCENEVGEEANEAEAMEDNTQTLTINRPKQQENKLLTVGNKKAYTVGKGDYQHRFGMIKDGCVIKEGKKEMGGIFNALHIEDKDILADLEDLLNNVIDNPDTVDELVNYLAKNAPAAHFISEMIGCGEIYNEESLLKFLDNAYMLSRKIGDAVGEVTIPPYYEARIGKYLNVAYPKPAFGKEFSLMQFEYGFDDARHKIANIIFKAKEEEAAEAEEEQEEEKEEAISNDAVQEHAEEDCEAYPADLEELQKLLEERRKKEAELDAEIKQAEEEERRKALIEELIAADNRIKEKEERLAQLRKK